MSATLAVAETTEFQLLSNRRDSFFGREQGDIFTRDGQAWQISYFDDASTPGIFELSGGNDVALLAVPEPGSVMLILCGVALLPMRRRRAL